MGGDKFRIVELQFLICLKTPTIFRDRFLDIPIMSIELHHRLLDIYCCPKCECNAQWLQEHDLRETDTVPKNQLITE